LLSPQDIKAIGETVNDDTFVADMQKLAAQAAPARPVEVRFRDKGRFRSVTMRCTFRTADEVYALYALLDDDERVMFKL
jgi:putative lipoic acid-binding regulatory protein